MSAPPSRRSLRSIPINLSSSSSLPPPITTSNSSLLQPPATASSSSSSSSTPISLITFTEEKPSSPWEKPITFFPPNSKLPNLTKSETLLLRQKQSKLRTTAKTTLSLAHSQQNAVLSTLILSSHSAGTAVIISPHGWVLTCAHCFADTPDEYASLKTKTKWLLSYDSTAVQISCRFFDSRRDLALCKITGIEQPLPPPFPSSNTPSIPIFSFLKIASTTGAKLKTGKNLICIGQPGAEDLESKTPNKKTKYNLFEISAGKYRGMVKGADPQCNEEIGSLKHDCWTYWGHSGAPLVSLEEGELVGVHSSWDDETCMRHGVPGVAIREFLDECGVLLDE